MSNTPRQLPTYRGRSAGLVLLVAAQALVGGAHAAFGLWFLFATPDVYGAYTTAFSLLTLFFAQGLWLQKRWGFVGTIAVSIFVVVADSLVLLDLPSVPGIPKFAGYGEIAYSILVFAYLLHINRRFR